MEVERGLYGALGEALPLDSGMSQVQPSSFSLPLIGLKIHQPDMSIILTGIVIVVATCNSSTMVY
jgi:hypothetical protein